MNAREEDSEASMEVDGVDEFLKSLSGIASSAPVFAARLRKALEIQDQGGNEKGLVQRKGVNLAASAKIPGSTNRASGKNEAPIPPRSFSVSKMRKPPAI